MTPGVRILFVDDDPHQLASLQATLHYQCPAWEMAFVGSGVDALTEIESARFDVIVTVLRMAEVDGFAVLTHARRRQPDAVRIVVTGSNDTRGALRASPLAHQIITKPCSSDLLRAVIEDTSSTLDLLASASMREAAGGPHELPALPQIYRDFAAAADAGAPFGTLADILEDDRAVSARLLGLVDAAALGTGKESSLQRSVGREATLERAVHVLGLDMLRSLLLLSASTRVFELGLVKAGLNSQTVEQRALVVARLVAKLVALEGRVTAIGILPVIHDIGRSVLAWRSPFRYARATKIAAAERTSIAAAEIRIFGHSHAEVGAYLLALWGFPFPIVYRVAHHEKPSNCSERSFGILGALHVADVLVAQRIGEHSTFDHEFIERCGATRHIATWESFASDIAA